MVSGLGFRVRPGGKGCRAGLELVWPEEQRSARNPLSLIRAAPAPLISNAVYLNPKSM